MMILRIEVARPILGLIVPVGFFKVQFRSSGFFLLVRLGKSCASRMASPA